MLLLALAMTLGPTVKNAHLCQRHTLHFNSGEMGPRILHGWAPKYGYPTHYAVRAQCEKEVREHGYDAPPTDQPSESDEGIVRLRETYDDQPIWSDEGSAMHLFVPAQQDDFIAKWMQDHPGSPEPYTMIDLEGGLATRKNFVTCLNGHWQPTDHPHVMLCAKDANK